MPDYRLKTRIQINKLAMSRKHKRKRRNGYTEVNCSAELGSFIVHCSNPFNEINLFKLNSSTFFVWSGSSAFFYKWFCFLRIARRYSRTKRATLVCMMWYETGLILCNSFSFASAGQFSRCKK